MPMKKRKKHKKNSNIKGKNAGTQTTTCTQKSKFLLWLHTNIVDKGEEQNLALFLFLTLF